MSKSCHDGCRAAAFVAAHLCLYHLPVDGDTSSDVEAGETSPSEDLIYRHTSVPVLPPGCCQQECASSQLPESLTMVPGMPEAHVAQVLRSIADFPTSASVCVITTQPEYLAAALWDFPDVRICGDSQKLTHPFRLAWIHREVIEAAFTQGKQRLFSICDTIRQAFKLLGSRIRRLLPFLMAYMLAGALHIQTSCTTCKIRRALDPI